MIKILKTENEKFTVKFGCRSWKNASSQPMKRRPSLLLSKRGLGTSDYNCNGCGSRQSRLDGGSL